ncbi:UNVERIFIED_CONTAM: hypothetical protein NCL1_48519 [Trichonephila clavipes]
MVPLNHENFLSLVAMDMTFEKRSNSEKFVAGFRK